MTRSLDFDFGSDYGLAVDLDERIRVVECSMAHYDERLDRGKVADHADRHLPAVETAVQKMVSWGSEAETYLERVFGERPRSDGLPDERRVDAPAQRSGRPRALRPRPVRARRASVRRPAEFARGWRVRRPNFPRVSPRSRARDPLGRPRRIRRGRVRPARSRRGRGNGARARRARARATRPSSATTRPLRRSRRRGTNSPQARTSPPRPTSNWPRPASSCGRSTRARRSPTTGSPWSSAPRPLPSGSFRSRCCKSSASRDESNCST